MKIITKKEFSEEKDEKEKEWYKKCNSFFIRNFPTMFDDVWIENCDEKIKNYVISKKEIEKRGLFIFGGAGVGKTHSLYAIARNAKINGFGVNVVNTVKLISEMRRDSLNRYEEKIFEEYFDYDGILFLDDIGAEKNSEFVEETLYQIINYRYENCCPTIFTSNLSLKELAEKNGDRLASRIAGMCEIIELKGEDKRI